MAARWGQGRVEILALREEILPLITQGFSVQQIFDDLKSQGKISVEKSAFHNHVGRLRSQIEQADPSPAPMVQADTVTSVEAHKVTPITLSHTGTFNHTPKADEETLSAIWGDDT